MFLGSLLYSLLTMLYVVRAESDTVLYSVPVLLKYHFRFGSKLHNVMFSVCNTVGIHVITHQFILP